MLSSILRDTPKPLTDLNPALPRDLAASSATVSLKIPDRRYQSAKDLRNNLDDLEQCLSSGDLAAIALPVACRRARGLVADCRSGVAC